MEITTKYNFNDFVYPIRKSMISKKVNCEMCDGDGFLKIQGKVETIGCPTCYGCGGSMERLPDRWEIKTEETGFIHKIDVEIYSSDHPDKESRTKYMLDSTGVGSGTLHPENSLWLSKKEAQAECDRLNKFIKEPTK